MSNVFIVSAPSGSGKSTLLRGVFNAVPDLIFSISYTTREPRGREKNGKDYFFITREEFEKEIERGAFLEHAEVFGNYYGTHRRFLEQATAEGKLLVLDIDVQGARQLKAELPDAVSIFILPPSRKELEKRLRARSEDSDEVIERRLRGAAKEIQRCQDYDYLIVNRDVIEATAELTAIIVGHGSREKNREAEVRQILDDFRQAQDAGRS